MKFPRIKRVAALAVLCASLAATAGLVWDILRMRPPRPKMASVIETPAESAAPAASTAPSGAQPAKEAKQNAPGAEPGSKPAAADDPGEAMPEPPIPGAQIVAVDEDAGKAARQCPGGTTGVVHLPSYDGIVDATHRLVAGRWFYCITLPTP